MDELVTIEPAPTLNDFCQHVIAKFAGNWPPKETDIADEFVTFFRVDFVKTVAGLPELCKSLGINVSELELPPGLHGHNCAFQDKREIVVAQQSGRVVLGSKQHTLLHELREIIEYDFVKIHRPTMAGLADREQRADDFASHVRAEAPIRALYHAFESRMAGEWSFGQICLAAIFTFAAIVYVLTCLTLPDYEKQLLG